MDISNEFSPDDKTWLEWLKNIPQGYNEIININKINNIEEIEKLNAQVNHFYRTALENVKLPENTAGGCGIPK